MLSVNHFGICPYTDKAEPVSRTGTDKLSWGLNKQQKMATVKIIMSTAAHDNFQELTSTEHGK